ncbi:hypothetical protein V9T40_014937 [Parthenolecanium corni]|uniref:Uncharacterized protein n=1 Tax=Parthenolecanium corni TaxID=536013 RepID=A0AAN9Y7F4_9HEMI
MGPQDGLTLGVSVCAGVFMETPCSSRRQYIFSNGIVYVYVYSHINKFDKLRVKIIYDKSGGSDDKKTVAKVVAQDGRRTLAVDKDGVRGCRLQREDKVTTSSGWRVGGMSGYSVEETNKNTILAVFRNIDAVCGGGEFSRRLRIVEEFFLIARG